MNLYLTNLYLAIKANTKYINQNTSFQYSSSFETQLASLFQELKYLMTGVMKSAEFKFDNACKKGEAMKTNF